MISVNRIKYAGYSSQDFDLICDLCFDADNGSTNTFLSREAVASETYKGTYKRTHSYKWSETLAPTLTFLKNDFHAFNLEEQRSVFKWLTSKDTPSFLTIYHDDTEVVSYEILGAFVSIETYKTGNDKVVGFVAKFESVAPWAFSALRTIIKTISSPTNNTFAININSDDNQNPIYPKIIIQQDSVNSIIPVDHAYTTQDTWAPGTVYRYNNIYYWLDAQGTQHTSSTNTSNITTTSTVLTNTYTLNGATKTISTEIKNNNIGETVTLDGANRVVASSRTTGRIFGDDFNFVWLPLFEGTNTISVVGNCTLTLQYRTVIKCGEY